MKLCEKLEELEHDFSSIFDTVDFSNYNPSSSQIQQLINIGLMWMLANEIKREKEENSDHVKDHIQDELMSAEEYYEKWEDEKDPTLKQMTKDELRHADYFIKQARMMAKNVEQQAKLQKYINWYNGILERIS